MKKKLLLMLTLCLLAQWSVAQAPKWVDKAKRAVFSVVTYDQNDKILNTGNGFFVTEDGVALSDYTLFKGAQRAVVMSSDGAQMQVEAIMGADDMYDVVKFRVGIPGKKVTALTLAAVAPAAGADVYLLPYSTQKDRSFTAGKVKEADKISGNYSYYTLDMRLKDKMVSCPLMTVDGQVFGLAQKSSGQDTATICYAIDANFAMSQNISALSYGDMSLKGIGIKKALPDTEEQALVFLYMASSQLSPEKYMETLNDFIAQYPASADGYLRRASQHLFMSREDVSMDKVAADMDKALEVAAKKDDVYYNRAKIIYNYALGKPEKVYKDWSLDKALGEVRKAIAIDELPVYVQLEGDIQFAKQDYPSAFTSYDKVNKTILASPATFFSAAKTKELMQAPAEEVLALMDSCVARFTPRVLHHEVFFSVLVFSDTVDYHSVVVSRFPVIESCLAHFLSDFHFLERFGSHFFLLVSSRQTCPASHIRTAKFSTFRCIRHYGSTIAGETLFAHVAAPCKSITFLYGIVHYSHQFLDRQVVRQSIAPVILNLDSELRIERMVCI